MQDTDPDPGPGLASWLRLATTPGVGPRSATLLLARFGTPAAIFRSSPDHLIAACGRRIGAALAAAPSPQQRERIDGALEWSARGGAIIARSDPGYPPLLRHIPDPPLLLFALGRRELLGSSALAMVGSRNASIEGERNARAFARALSEAGITVVSGLALGIDAAAHEGALAGAGSTVAVVGTGPDQCYPARNRPLMERVAHDGCLVSEYLPGTPVRAAQFPRRNRIISGLCAGVLVVEAAAQSGSLITAHCALEQGRDVFAIPGSIHAALSKGCHALIKQGAKLVESASDILVDMNRPACVPDAPQLCVHSEVHTQLLALLDGGISDAYAIAGRTGYAAAFVITQLLSLELDGLVERLPGGMFRRLA